MTQPEPMYCPNGCESRFTELKLMVLENRKVSEENEEKIKEIDRQIRGNGKPGLLMNQALIEQKLDQVIALVDGYKKAFITIAIGFTMLVITSIWQLVLAH